MLKHFNIDIPEFLNDVKIKIEDIDYYKNFCAKENVSILRAYEEIRKKSVTAIPITSENKKLLGLLTLKAIANELISGKFDKIETSYKNILETLKAEEIIKIDEEINGNILVASYGSETILTNIEMDSETILIVGNRNRVIDYAISNRIKLLVVIGGHKLSEEQLNKAKENKVNIIATQYDAFYTAKLIGLSNYVKN